MGEGIGHRGDCSRRLYLPKSLVVDKEEGVIMLQWPSKSSAELIADEGRDRTVCQIEVILRVEGRVPVQFPQRSVKLVTAGLGCHVDDRATMPAELRIESLGQNLNLFQLIQTEKKSGSACRRKAENRIGRIHSVDQNVRHTRTYAINCHLPSLTVGKQRRSAAGVWSHPRLQCHRTKKIAVVEGQFRQALRWNESLDSRRRAVNGGGARVDRGLLGKVADRELRVDHHFGCRSELQSVANLRLKSGLLYAERIRSSWQAGETVFADRVGRSATFQSGALADNRDRNAADNSASWVGNGAGNGRKLGLRPRTD